MVLTKRECTPGSVAISDQGGGGRYGSCGRWRRHVLRRIEKAGRRAIVAISGDTTYTAYRGGEELHGEANSAALEAGYVATIEQLRRAGARVIVIRDAPEAPFDVPGCVAADISDPSACDFPLPDEPERNFDRRPDRLSRRTHLTARFARTLSGAFEPALGHP